jgi:proteasome lid subunit RPN8/RPN11
MTSTSTYSDPGGSSAEAHNHDDGLHIQAGQPELRDLPVRTPPALDHVQWHGPENPGGSLTLIYHQEALAQIQNHGLANLDVEVGGVLLGHVYRYQDQVILEIQDILPADSADHGPFHFTFTADAWAQINRDRATHYPDLDILGWFHTHPDLGVFYSADDVVVHTAAFSMAWHVGIVVDPINNEVAHFGWQNGEIAPLPGFYELLEVGDKSIIPWRSVRTAVWHETYESHLAAQLAREQKRITIGGVSIPADALPLVGGALIVLAAFLLMATMLFISNQRVNRLENISNDLFTANLAAAETVGLADCKLSTTRIFAPYPGQVIMDSGIVPVYGAAVEPGIPRYRLQVSSENSAEPMIINEFRRGLANNTRVLGRWDTTNLPAGTYQLDLVGLNRDGLPEQAGDLRCTIAVTLER